MHANGKPLARRIDLNLCELFDAIYRTRNLTQAGERLGLSQPAVSHGLAKLRDLYRDDLFVRMPRGVRPTPLADELAEPLARALDIVRATTERAAFVPADTRQTFRIAMPDIGERMFLPVLLPWLARHAPQALLETLTPDLPRLSDGLAEGDIDLAIGFFPGLGKQIHQKVLFAENFVYVFRPGLASRQPIGLADVKRLPHAIAEPPGTDYARVVEHALADAGIRAPIALRVNSFLSLAPIAASADYLALIPHNLAAVVAPGLCVSPPPMPVPGFDVSLYWHHRYHRNPAHTWLRAGIAQLFGGARPFLAADSHSPGE